ncbi:unnamed protein product [Discula destructiva]
MSPTTQQTDVVDAGEGSSSGVGHLSTRDNAPLSSPVQERKSTLPSVLKFPLVAILSMSVSSLGYSFINEFTWGELATIMRPLDTSRDVSVMTAWRVAELAIGWFANFDSLDLAALNFLSHAPTFYLMTAFYNLNYKTALAGLAVDVAASFIPFSLLRSLSKAHKADATLANRDIIVDRPILILSTLFATFIYTVSLFVSYKAYLRTALVLYFEGIYTIEPSQNSLIILTTLALFSGIAARSFIFTPLAATGRTAEDEKNAGFDAVDAGLVETFWWNVWGYTTQTKVGMARTMAVVAVTGINTYLQCALTINGVDSQGAVAYAAVWAVAAFLAGVGLGFVGEA